MYQHIFSVCWFNIGQRFGVAHRKQKVIHNSVGRHNPGVLDGCILSKLLFCERMQISIYYFKNKNHKDCDAARKKKTIVSKYNLIIIMLIRLNKYS